jgi:GT2 family glycosyltransferase
MRAIQGTDAEVWVVDNNSVDGSVEMVAEKFPTVKLIANKENAGFSRANNQAIRQSNAEYVLLLNPDTVLQDDTLKKCIAFMEEHPDAGGLGVRMIDGKGKFLPESKRGLPTPEVAFYKMAGLSALFPKSKKFGRYHLKYLPEFENHEVEVLSGAFMMMRSSVLEKTGLLDEDFFMYGEDIDLSYRITKAGFKNYYFSGSTIIHYKGESTKKRSANYVKVFYNAMVLFARKHYSMKAAGWFNFFIQFAIYLRAFVALCWRFAGAVLFPLLDFIAVYIGFFAITRYWEEYNKYVRDFYPQQYFLLHIPAYILLIIFGIYLSGGYDRPLSARRIIRGSAAGSVLLFAVYAFLPKDLQFSRAILFLGCAWSVAAPLLVRAALNLFSKGKAGFTAGGAQRIIIVAQPDEASRIQGLLAKGLVRYEYLSTVSSDNTKPEGYAGVFSQLGEVIDIYRANLVIFSARDVVSGSIMEIMSQYADSDVHFKIVPEDSQFVIGSNNKNDTGELYTIDLKFMISEPSVRRKKRLLDLAICALVLLCSPVLLFSKNRRQWLGGLLAVLLGNKTWVSYNGRPGAERLPSQKTGVFYPVQAYPNSELEPDINLAYARDYDVNRDIKALLRNI